MQCKTYIHTNIRSHHTLLVIYKGYRYYTKDIYERHLRASEIVTLIVNYQLIKLIF